MQPKIINKSYTYSTPRNGHDIVAIVAHSTVGRDSRTYLATGGGRRVSVHALIWYDDTIYQYVPDSIGANHAGFGTMPKPWSNIPVNQCTIGFELENPSNGKDISEPYPDLQLLAMGWWINAKRRLHGPIPILRHGDIDPTRRSDPVNLSVADMERWCAKAAIYYGTREAENKPGLYRVKPKIAATVRQAPNRESKIAGTLPADTPILVDEIKHGQLVNGDDRWAHMDRSNPQRDLGFIHMSALVKG